MVTLKHSSMLKRIFSVTLIVAMLFASSTISAHAKTVYYPSSGLDSGVFYGRQSSSATFTLPASTIHIVYVLDCDTNAELRFKYGNSYVSRTLIGDNVCRDVTITLPFAGQYQVYVYVPNPTSYEKIFAYNLYKS